MNSRLAGQPAAEASVKDSWPRRAAPRFGIVTSIPALPGRSDDDLYRETTELVQVAEELGFDTCWFTEHHFSRHGINSAILTTIAALAAQTRRIRFGSAVCVLPFWNPVRLAEEVAVVDLISQGRFEFGVGSGYRLHEFEGLGVPVDERTERFHESLEVLEGLWSGQPFSYSGRHFQIRSRGLRPRPTQRPHPPLWVAAQNAAGVRWAAEHEAGWMFVLPRGQTLDGWRPARDLYFDLVAARSGTARVYLHLPTYVVSKPSARVRAEAEPWVEWWVDAVGEGETIWNVGATGSADARRKAVEHILEHGFFGDPDAALRQIECYATFGVTDFTFHVPFGPPRESVLESMETLARRVVPEARRLVGGMSNPR